MEGGPAWVDRTLQILSDKVVRTMKPMQVLSIAELEPKHAIQLQQLGPQGKAAK